MFEIGRLVNSIEELLLHCSDYTISSKYEYKNEQKIKIEYLNLPFAFDIETTSFYIDEEGNQYHASFGKDYNKDDKKKLMNELEKRALCWSWQIGLNGYCYIAKSWEEFHDCMETIASHFNLNARRRMICFIHNMGFEYQWYRKRIDWVYDGLFCREERKPMYALSTSGIEYRCSYFLSGMGLAKTLENCTKYKVEKMVGDLDYDEFISPLGWKNGTITEKEIGYCVNDVIGLNCYIQEQIELYEGKISKLPLTNTGRVREHCRKYCFSKNNRQLYRIYMDRMKIRDMSEYQLLKRASSGGHTHANKWNSEITLGVGRKDFWGRDCGPIYSYDETSAYPAQMLSKKYPMSSGQYFEEYDVELMKKQSKDFAFVFDIEFTLGFEEKIRADHILSASKCFEKGNYNHTGEEYVKNCICDNGRIESCDWAMTSMNDVDFSYMEKFYKWYPNSIRITNVRRYVKAHLPKALVEAILVLYENKTKLKNVKGKEEEYQNSKSMLNATFGCAYTDIVNDIVEYIEDEWKTSEGDGEDQLQKYNKNKKRFLFYAWAGYITSYNRGALYDGIIELGRDYIYADTDSLKFMHLENHKQFFEDYNKKIMEELTTMCKGYRIDIEKIQPETIKGKKKPLGVWDDESVDTPEGHMYAKTFKTLGAKRYLVEHWVTEDEEGNKLETPHWEIECTIAGVNKHDTSKFFNEHYEKAFDMFDNYLTVPADYSGRVISSYIDYETEGDFIDRDGNVYHYNEKSSIHMAPTSYNLTMSPIYLMILKGRMTNGTD